ncbi:MAG: hypothetical protein JWN50_84 [Parcubacteria group bacterium]|nr:hypothetical protein [Parcubacteria group bacterium]
MPPKPSELYHGSSTLIEGPLTPILVRSSEDHIHDRPAVFATERMDLAALFMLPESLLHSIGFEEDIAYICIWGTAEEITLEDKEGYMYVFSSDSFEKIGKGYEWQSFVEVMPVSVRKFEASVGGMIECGVQVYFINDDPLFDKIVLDKDHRAEFLKNETSENQKSGRNIKLFS